jgi:hypothetical protein
MVQADASDTEIEAVCTQRGRLSEKTGSSDGPSCPVRRGSLGGETCTSWRRRIQLLFSIVDVVAAKGLRTGAILSFKSDSVKQTTRFCNLRIACRQERLVGEKG